MSHRPHNRVPAADLRRRFNDGDYWERAQSGEFVERVIREDEPTERARRRIGLPHGSVSQMVAYELPDGSRVALVHQYVRPDGSVGASGQPDPKWLMEGGVIYACERRA